MKALTGGVNFYRCEKVNCFLKILLTDEYSKIMYFTSVTENQVSGTFEQCCSFNSDNTPCVLLRTLKTCCAISHSAVTLTRVFCFFNLLA